MKNKDNKKVVKQAINIPGGGYFSLLKDKLSTINKTNLKVRLKVVISTIVVGLFIVLISTSYALWTVSIEKNNNLNIVAGVLNYELTSPELNGNKQVVVPANSEKLVNVTLKSLNAIDSDYSVYYQGSLPSGVTIMYDGTNSKPSDNISITGTTKSIGVIIVNKSSSNYTATLGVKGGLTNKVLALDSNTYQITNTYSFSKDYAYTGNYQTFTASVSGYYNLEAWGAQGGGLNNNRFTGGNGAYTKGLIYLNKNETVNIYVGGQGTANGNGGYNGGGNAGTLVANNFGGGGATDFRLTAGVWNDITSLRSRIMVSAGGGGSGIDPNSPNYVLNGGAGGTLFGITGVHSVISDLADTIANSGTGGTQNSGGKGGGKSGYNTASPGTFGIGGIGSKSIGSPDTRSGSGGGGGYYGGGAGIGWQSPGGAPSSSGSSFISGYAGVNAISSSGGHTNQTMHFSNKYFINGEMQAGINTGNGKAKITYISSSAPTKINTKLNNVRYIKDCSNGGSVNNWNGWVEIEAIKNGINVAKDKVVTGTVASASENSPYTVVTDGVLSLDLLSGAWGSQCITVDLGETYDLDEAVIWHKWYSNRYFNNHTFAVSNNNSNWVNLIDNRSGYIESVNGNRISAYQTTVRNNYNITVQQQSGGTFNIFSNAHVGDNVTFNPVVAAGNTYTSYTYVGATITYNGGTINLKADQRNFIMPASDIVVIPKYEYRQYLLTNTDRVDSVSGGWVQHYREWGGSGYPNGSPWFYNNQMFMSTEEADQYNVIVGPRNTFNLTDWNYIDFTYYVEKPSGTVTLLLLSQVGVAWYNPGITLKGADGITNLGNYVSDTIRMDVRDMNRSVYIGAIIQKNARIHLTSMALVK